MVVVLGYTMSYVRRRANAVAIVLVAFVAAVAVVAAVAHSAYPGLDNVSEKARCCVVVVYRTFLLIVPRARRYCGGQPVG